MKNLFTNKLILIVFVVFSLSYTNAFASPEEAKKFIENVSKNALDILNSDTAQNQKEEKLTKLFTDSVDTKWIARFAMGKYWNDATEAQRSKYVETHKKFILKNYIPKFKEYSGQKIKITKSYADSDNEDLVETKIISNDETAVNIDYKVRKNQDGHYMIFDVVAEGVSLITTERSDFASILTREGIDPLIEKLATKG